LLRSASALLLVAPTCRQDEAGAAEKPSAATAPIAEPPAAVLHKAKEKEKQEQQEQQEQQQQASKSPAAASPRGAKQP
jgi:hypothetical protein